jgi:hypothetical protein
MSRGPLIAVVGLVVRLLAAPDAATAQVFIASHPTPEFTIGPLFVRANVGPAAGPVDVTVLFSVVAPATIGSNAVAQDIYLLWPGEVDGESVAGAPDPELSLCGPDPEERERLSAPGRRTLVYRGRRVVPHGRRRLGWLATVHRWDVEHHEVEIELDGDRVRDVQAQIHRSRLTQPGLA